MKKIHLLSILFAASLLIISCQEDLPSFHGFSSYTYSTEDKNGGEWRTTLIASPNEIAIPVPGEVTSGTYQAELEAAIKANADATDQQKDAVKYWTNNPVIRWNEIAMELIAKYNLIPGPTSEDVYILPDPANPDGPSKFPFAHPPYAVRALAYLSAAQFDGLITAWHYKYLYNRPAASTLTQQMKTLYDAQNIPAYPSEGAVIAASALDVLKVMFPLEADYLTQKYNDAIEALGVSGHYVNSDIQAGITIGKAIAAKALARASTDGMKSAQTPKPISDSIKQAAIDRFGWYWENLELPTRPVGLTPLYGKVKMWNVPNVTDVRPGPPPSIGTKELDDDIKKLEDIANSMTRERRAIANFWQDGLGTYTPPGHWNKIATDLIVANRLNPLRTARTFAYLNMAMMDGGIACWDAKYYYHYPRPIQLIPGFRTIAGTPNFPSYTSGHSVFSAAGAEILAYVFPEKATTLREWALEAAVSRVYGGIHWSFDATVGTTQGIDVANYTLTKAKSDGAE